MYSKFVLKILLLFFIITGSNQALAQLLFKPNQTPAIAEVAAEVCSGDINNDGLDDVVYATGLGFNASLGYKIFVYTQTAAGTLSNTAVYPYQPVYPGLKCMRISDVNNDGLKDVVIGYGDSIGVFRQNAGGLLNPVKSYFSGTDVDAISCGDLNNDGLTDIAVCHWNATFMRVFYQNGTGFSSSTYAKPNGGYDEIEIGDVNSDNLNDLVFVSAQNNGIHIYTQKVTGQLNNYVTSFPAPGNGQNKDLAIGDLNNDGANDIVVSRGGNMPSANLLIWFQNATGGLGTQLVLPAYDIPEAVEIHDLNCDGKPEIYAANAGWNAISSYSQNPGGAYTTYQLNFITAASHYNSSAMSFGDLDNNGRVDIVSLANTIKLNILYNVSKPIAFTGIDTLITIDTTYRHTQTFSYFYTETSTDTLVTKWVVKLDSMKVTFTNKSDSVRIDTFLYRTGQICGRLYQDTVLNQHIYTHFYYQTDTVLWSSGIDTFYVGLKEINTVSAALNIYPNPTAGKLYLKFDETLKRPDELSLEIIDNSGKLVNTGTLGGHSDEIDLSAYIDGIYTLVISYEGKCILKKVIKKE